MHREGYGLLSILAGLALLLTLGYVGFREQGGLLAMTLRVMSLLLWLASAFVIFFFRDPERDIPTGPGLVVSPADGTVIGIDEIDEPDFMHARTKRVIIFLSPFNVHVNRVPNDGEVKYFRYQAGRFLVASEPAASTENEQSIIGLETPDGKILFKQIAGILARRIVCEIRQGHRVRRGERFGIIKFGSRMEVFMPLNTEIKVRLREKVRAGESIIGEIKHAA
ncbi:MAG: phosphatidylserine decarboxylase family protein [candidate division KSB1 bacterium]|nr:phosphatidylserine decarboxylase family protein [candidate division KSB1 bacterium]MDZ7366508.1 phosphatidylserine decarboxylase family protein [candidate division KSB1 bacterium]MDZ7404530.1 phosphatidylserine decarboxylase family protein [candidate division KSB1 bacterium]